MTLTKIDDRGLNYPLELQDNEQLRIGTNNKAQLYHSGTQFYLNNDNGNIYIRLNNSTNAILVSGSDGSVKLYHNGNKKLETTSTGISITGEIVASGGVNFGGGKVSINVNSNVMDFVDNFALRLGNSQDLAIYHNGNHSKIRDEGTGNLYIESDNGNIYLRVNNNEQAVTALQNGAVELFFDDNKKIETLSTGAKVTGDLEITGGITSTSRTNRNLIINGAMTVAQRGTSSTDTGYRTVDRFRVTYGGLNENLTQEQVDVASGTTPYTLGFRKAFKITNGNQTGGAGTNDFIIFGYKAEAQDIANSGWNYKSSSSYVTLSFWIKSSVAQDFKGHLYTPDGTQQIYAFATGSLSANTWTKVTKTIPGHSNITIDNDNGEGFHVNIAPFFGTSFTSNSVTEDAWATYNSATRMKDNTSTWYTTNDATLEITGMQLEVGSVATDFEHLPYCDVMRRCMRYFYATRGDGTLGGVNDYASGIFGFGLNGNIVGGGFRYPEPMRAAPSLTLIRPSDGATNGLHLFRGVTGSHGGVDKTSSAVTFVDVGRYGYLYITFSINVIDQGGGFLYHIIASAEL